MAIKESYFSVHFDLILRNENAHYDLFVNASSLKEKERFVRIFPRGDHLSEFDLSSFKTKYLQLYVPESQRHLYMQSLVKSGAYTDVEKANVLKSSALNYLNQIFDKNKEFNTEVLSQSIEGCREVVELMVDVLDDYSIDDLKGLIGDLSFHDFYTYDHSINVSMYCISIYKTLFPNAPRTEIVHAGLGGLLHDLGKIKIPTSILNNPGGLSQEEYEQIKKHPGFGIELLLSGQVKVQASIDLSIIARVVHEHHENVDGTGYPNKLKGEDIHLMAKVCTIADFFDALTTKRSYNQIITVAEAANVMRKFRGKKLDEKIFDVFEKHLHFIRSDYTRDMILGSEFDPTLPYNFLPLTEIRLDKKHEFGKIKVLEKPKKPAP
jgi:HD-GYP domain-containing protein (c-di-GMP phosphodiesterase class II)